MKLTRLDMLQIMQESGALDDLDISEEDFLDGHGREDIYVKVMELTWAMATYAGPCLNPAPVVMLGAPQMHCTLVAGHAGAHTNAGQAWTEALQPKATDMSGRVPACNHIWRCDETGVDECQRCGERH